MVSVAERKRLYSVLFPNTHTLIHNIKSHPAESFFFNPQIDGSERRKGLWLTDLKKKKKKEEGEWEKEQPGQNGRVKEKAPAEKIWEAECTVGEREKWWGETERKKRD